MQAAHFVGMPEAVIPLAHATTYLASAPKSNASYTAYQEAREEAARTPGEPVPLHLRNAPTELMRSEGYGEGYRYAHDFAGGVTDQQHLPPGLRGKVFYRPKPIGAEARLIRYLDAVRRARRERPGREK
jgi:putative ATPase